MRSGKRGFIVLIIIGVLLAVLTPCVLWQWYFSPNAYWQRAESRRKALEQTKEKNEKVAVRATLPGYAVFLHRFPRHPKAAAARVIITSLLERLERRDLRLLEVRAGAAAFYGNPR